MPRNARVSAAVCVLLVQIQKDGSQPKVLLGQRKGPIGTGLWATPGGWLEDGEQPIDAAVRELFEETGISIHHSELQLSTCVATDLPEVNTWCVVTTYVAYVGEDLQPKELEPDKIGNWTWHDPRVILDKTIASVQPTLDKCFGKWLSSTLPD